MEITKPSSWRKAKTQIFQCTSGLTVRMRRMTLPEMTETMGRLNLEISRGVPLDKVEKMIEEKVLDPKMGKNLLDAAQYLLPRVITEPKMTLEETDDPDILSFEDLDPGEIIELFDGNLDLSGVTGAIATRRKKFRTKPAR